jgi:predicted dehydrogenase
MGATHLKAWRKLPGVEVAAVFDTDERRLSGDLSSVEGNFGGPAGKLDFTGIATFREVDALLAHPKLDAVDICLPTHLHSEIARRALEMDLDVLVEKPMALEGAGCDLLVAEAAARGRILMAAQVLRFWPEYTALRDAVNAAQFGAVRSAALRRRCAAPGWGGWLGDPARSGGGAFDLLIHDADMCLHLFGAPEAVSATGFADAAHGLDTLDARLYYPGGAVVTVEGGWFHSGLPFTMGYTVVFEDATVNFDSAGTPPTLYCGPEGPRPLALAPCDAYAAEIEYFAGCCRGRQAPALCPPGESAAAVKLMRLLLAARERQGEKIRCTL